MCQQVPEWTKCTSREKRKDKVEKPFYSDSEGESGPTESADSGEVLVEPSWWGIKQRTPWWGMGLGSPFWGHPITLGRLGCGERCGGAVGCHEQLWVRGMQ